MVGEANGSIYIWLHTSEIENAFWTIDIVPIVMIVINDSTGSSQLPPVCPSKIDSFTFGTSIGGGDQKELDFASTEEDPAFCRPRLERL